jgi:hypothetical protein
VTAGVYQATYVAPAPASSDEVISLDQPQSGFQKELSIPLREDLRRLLVGVRLSLTHDLGDLVGARVGLDLWAPFRIRSAVFGSGLSASYARAAYTVRDPTGALSTEVRADFVPVTARLAYEVYAGRRFSAALGAGVVATGAQFVAPDIGARDSGWGVGGLAFGTAGFRLGPGQLFLDLLFSSVAVRSGEFFLDAGGVGIEAGYRLGVF